VVAFCAQFCEVSCSLYFISPRVEFWMKGANAGIEGIGGDKI
jgi:hypothetical protein